MRSSARSGGEPSIAEHFLEAFDGTKIRWFDAGHGYPVVISLPIGLHPDFLKPLIYQAAGDFRFLFLQSRGLWGSQRSADPGNDSIDAHARDIATLVQVAQLADYSAIGYCGGSAPLVHSLSYAKRLPDRLLLLSTLFRRGNFEQTISRLIVRLQESRRPDSYRALLGIAFRFGARAFEQHAIAEICTANRFESFLRQLRSFYLYDFPRKLLVQHSVTLATAEFDIESIRLSTDKYHQELVNTSKRKIDVASAGHFFLYEDPVRATQLLVDWVSQSQTN